MKKSRTFIFIIVILQPIVDMITSWMTKYGFAKISLGSTFKFLIMMLLFLFILRYLWTKKKVYLHIFLLSYGAILATLVINQILKPHFILFEEINFTLKTAFYLTMLYTCMVLLLKKTDIRLLLYRAVTYVACIIGISYWLAIFSGTSIQSYTYTKPGFSGWFYSANELSVTVIILLALTMLHVFEIDTANAFIKRNPSKSLLNWLAFLLMLSMVPMLGTKTAYAGGVLLLLLYGVILAIKGRFVVWRDKRFIQLFTVGVLFLIAVPFTPASETSEHLQPDNELHLSSKESEIIQNDSASTLLGRILSGRDIYLQHTNNDFIEATPIQKLFGLGYAGMYTEFPKLIEMDFFDLFYGYGIIGTFLLLIPLCYVVFTLVRFPMTIEQFILLTTLAMCLGIAFLAGHVLFAPAVMTYVTILLAVLINAKQCNEDVSQRKKLA